MERLSYGVALFFVVTLPWEGLITLGSLGSLARILGLFVGALWLIKVAGDRQLRAPSGLHLVMMAMVAWMALSMNWSADPAKTRSTLVTVVMLFVLTYMIWDLVDTRPRLMNVMQAFVVGAAVPVYLVIEARLAAEGGVGRLTAASFHPNDLAMVLSLAIPLAGHLAFRSDRILLVRVGNFLMVPLAMFASLMTGSRSGLLAVLLGVGYVLILVIQSLPPGKSAALIAVLLAPVALLPAVADRLLQRLLGTGEALTTGLNGRMEIWTDALTIFNQRPLGGTGAGAFESTTAAANPPHNIVISFGAELGIMGIIILVTLLAVLAVKAWQNPPDMRALWVVVLLAWGANAAFHNIEYRKQTWLMFALVVVAAEVDNRLQGRRLLAPARATTSLGY